MINISNLIEKLEGGYVLNRKFLIDTIITYGRDQYERGCENMRLKMILIMKRTKAIREEKEQKLFNQIIEQASDYAYEERQKSYYGENLENHPDKRVRTVPEGEVPDGKGGFVKAHPRHPKTF